MKDLFESISEATEERIAIKIDAGIGEAVSIEQTRKEMHSCEVRSVLRRCYPRGEEAKEYFSLVEKHRGKESADRLRDDVRAEWIKRKNEEQRAK